MATIVISNTGGNYNAAGTWVGGVIPTSADTVSATTTSGPLGITTGAVAGSVDFTQYLNTLSVASNYNLYGSSLILGSGMTLTGAFNIVANNPNVTLKSNGKTCNVTLVFSNAVTGGTITFSDAWTSSATLQFAVGANSTVNITSTLTSTSLLQPQGVALFFSGGTIKLSGGFTLGAGTSPVGTTVINVTGTTTVTGSGGAYLGTPFVINAGAGIVTFPNAGIFGYASTTNTFTYTSGVVVTSGNTLYLGPSTLNTNGINWDAIIASYTGGGTINLTSPLNANSLLLSFGPYTFGGTSGFNIKNLSTTGAIGGGGTTHTLAAGVNYTITSAFTSTNGTSANREAFKSSVSGTKAILTLAQGATCDLSFVNATDIDSSQGRTIWTYKGVLTGTTNWNLLNTNNTTITALF